MVLNLVFVWMKIGYWYKQSPTHCFNHVCELILSIMGTNKHWYGRLDKLQKKNSFKYCFHNIDANLQTAKRLLVLDSTIGIFRLRDHTCQDEWQRYLVEIFLTDRIVAKKKFKHSLEFSVIVCYFKRRIGL